MRHVCTWLVVAAGIAATARSAPASASVLLALDTAEIVRRADHIAVVDVMSARAAWNDKRRRIITTIELSVVERWKGAAAPASQMTIVQPGGTVGATTMIVFGMPRFIPGERALVFLAGPARHATVVGMTQGKRLVRRAANTGQSMVDAPAHAGAAFVRTAASGAPAPIFDRNPRRLEDVRAEVRALLATAGGR